jgi:hypothetical protein
VPLLVICDGFVGSLVWYDGDDTERKSFVARECFVYCYM